VLLRPLILWLQRKTRMSRGLVVAQKFTTLYHSAIVFGKESILTDDEEKRHALNCLLEKYSPGYISEGQVEIANDWERLCVVEIQVEHMTGKTSIEMINNQG